MRWRKGLRNGDRNKGELGREGQADGEGQAMERDKRWNRLDRRLEGKPGCGLG